MPTNHGAGFSGRAPGFTGLKVLYTPEQAPKVDIVAIHGIGADPDKTWELGNVNWLNDPQMLPSIVPEARIMRYGYESDWYGENPIKQSLHEIATSFLSDLHEKRENNTQRPLIFIGHCFGGLIIQKAITRSKTLDYKHPGIFTSLSGVIFLGTPHRGTSDTMSRGLLLFLISAEQKVKVDGTILHALEQENPSLNDTLNEFTTLCNAKNVKLCCFFEQRKTKVWKIVGEDLPTEFVVDETSACLDGHDRRGLGLDHFRLNKFPGPGDGYYKAVIGPIRRMIGGLDPQTRPSKSELWDPRRQESLIFDIRPCSYEFIVTGGEQHHRYEKVKDGEVKVYQRENNAQRLASMILAYAPMETDCSPVANLEFSDSQYVKIFGFAPEQADTFSGIAIQSTEHTKCDTRVSNLYYGKNVFNFRIDIQDTAHKVHLSQLYRSNYKSSIEKKPYMPKHLVQARPEGQSDVVVLAENIEVEFNLREFQRMCPFFFSKLIANAKRQRTNCVLSLAILFSEYFWLEASILQT
ncbi:hypothetical protein MMC07_004600 [Pseudocyphellaria aurata]|nr:hypothetical protein [Pseudocyphellaria aurata]